MTTTPFFRPDFLGQRGGSVDFTAFRSALQLTDTDQHGYDNCGLPRGVARWWKHGGLAVVSRGDGSLMQVKG